MIKVDKHLLLCDCADCRVMFPHDRYDAVWAAPRPAGEVTRAVSGVPIGAPRAPLHVVLWVSPNGRLATDWPGFPGSAGARVELGPPDADGTCAVSGTNDPVLMALAAPVPLRRLLAERFAARCAVDYGLAPPDTADFVTCATHGESGIGCLTCEHVAESDGQIDVAILYSPDGDYPDLFCLPCVGKLASRELDSIRSACSRCQQAAIYRHRIVSSTWYGARP